MKINTSNEILVLNEKIEECQKEIKRLEKIACVEIKVGGIIRYRGIGKPHYYKVLKIKKNTCVLSMGCLSIYEARKEKQANLDGFIEPLLDDAEDFTPS
jgi:hypothetical protein